MRINVPTNQSPTDALLAVTGRLNQYFTDVILDRAEGYADPGTITLDAVSPTNITASAYGSSRYNLTVDLQASTITANCSCPYGGNCKHLAAFFQLLATEWADQLDLFGNLAALEVFSNHLKSLTKKQLIELVDRFAPDHYRAQIYLRQVPSTARYQQFRGLQQQLSNFLDQEHYDSDDFTEKLQAFLDQLLAFFESDPESVRDAIIHIIERVQQLEYEGYLYHHYDDSNYQGDQVLELAAKLILACPANQRLDYFQAINDQVTSDHSYGTFSGFLLDVLNEAQVANDSLSGLENLLTDANYLKSLPEYEQTVIVQRLDQLLAPEELLELKIQLSPNNADILLNVAQSLAADGKQKRAIKLLDERLGNKEKRSHYFHSGKLYETRIRLAARHETKKAVHKWCKRYLRESPTTHTLTFACEQAPKKRKDWIDQLTPKSPESVANFHVEQADPDAVLSLLDAYPDIFDDAFFRLEFFTKYPGHYPERAEQLAFRLLEEYLPHTGVSTYRIVLQALELLRDNAAPETTLQTAQDVKTNYRRRRKLMGMLTKGGF